MKITLVRHGETDFNKEGKIQGLSNNLLNDTGRRQCRDLRMRLSDQHFDFCYMSPLARTVETAMILIGDRVEMIPDKRLIERDMGDIEGNSRELYAVDKFWDYNLNSGDQNIEKIQDIFERCRDFLDYVIKKHPGKDILIVSHGAPVRAMHHILRKSNLTGNLRDINIKNCYCETIEFDENDIKLK
ncbi:MAG: histidine phosphatase family protein [Tenericutes bacterium]|nr:histidine phosphatase family protein [Mycoplasmatota bacterium]